MPIISDKIPNPCRELKAGDIMTPNPITLKQVSSMSEIRDVLDQGNHHAYPLTNQQNDLVGIIPRNFILTIIKNKAWYGADPKQDSFEAVHVGKYAEMNRELSQSVVDSNKYQTRNDLKVHPSKVFADHFDDPDAPMHESRVLPW